MSYGILHQPKQEEYIWPRTNRHPRSGRHNPGHALLTHAALADLAPAVRYARARDGEEALNFLFAKGNYSHRSNAAPRPLVLLGLNLPLMSGRSVLRPIKGNSLTHDIPVVMFTASADETDVAMCRLMGAADYVNKSAQVGEHIDSIRRICQQWLAPDANGQMSLAA